MFLWGKHVLMAAMVSIDTCDSMDLFLPIAKMLQLIDRVAAHVDSALVRGSIEALAHKIQGIRGLRW